MCGITGFVGIGNDVDLKKMTYSLKHRGPDAIGFFSDINNMVYFGHTRLSILDINLGQQPMSLKDGSLTITFNGEIYNHLEIRKILISKGYKFYTKNSDTETILNGWKEWGLNLPIKLNGMFAFAIWDKNNKKIYLVRDRFGEKPLFWSVQNNNFYFGSELNSISSHSFFKSEIDIKTQKKFFAYGYIPSPNSILKQTQKLKAGNILEFSIINRKYKIVNYWSYKIEPTYNNRNINDLGDEFLHLLQNSIRLRQQSDVPVGVLLSGGIDSSSILAMSKNFINLNNINTFSIGFKNKSYDESYYSNLVAANFKTNHRLKIFEDDNIFNLIDTILSKIDEPISDPSLLPTYILSAFVKKHVKVALSGDGGDELFAGYDPFKALRPALLYKLFIPNVATKTFKKLIDFLPRTNRNMSLDFKLKRFFTGITLPISCWNPSWMGPLQPDEISDFFNEKIYAEELYSEAIELWNRESKLDNLDKSLEFFVNFYLQDNILVKTDRSSMLNGLECRSVFLDPNLAEFSCKLPNKYKLYRNQQKYIMHHALKNHLPKTIINRKKKGFGIPILPFIDNYVNNNEIKNINGVKVSSIEKIIQEHKVSNNDQRLAIWSYLSFLKSTNDYSKKN